MRKLCLFVSLHFVCVATPVFANDVSVPALRMVCTTGPITKTFGKSNWLVHSCADRKSLVFVAAPGNPAFPVKFSVLERNGKYQVSGEGTGDKWAAAPFFEHLQSLSEKDRSAIVEETLRDKRTPTQ